MLVANRVLMKKSFKVPRRVVKAEFNELEKYILFKAFELGWDLKELRDKLEDRLDPNHPDPLRNVLKEKTEIDLKVCNSLISRYGTEEGKKKLKLLYLTDIGPEMVLKYSI